jgi:hypothetical protein
MARSIVLHAGYLPRASVLLPRVPSNIIATHQLTFAGPGAKGPKQRCRRYAATCLPAEEPPTSLGWIGRIALAQTPDQDF